MGIVKSVDALSRDALLELSRSLGGGAAGPQVPVLLPGAQVRQLPVVPALTAEDRMLASLGPQEAAMALELLPEIALRLSSRISARLVRSAYLPAPDAVPSAR